MFTLALLIGLYSYSIFFLGVAGLLTPGYLLPVSLFWSFFILWKIGIYLGFRIWNLEFWSKAILFLIILQLLVNLIGSLGPELGFDALWYHLTLPKMWLADGSLKFYPGSVFKYSVMPMLTEMLYLPALSFGGAVLAKLIHYSFGVLTLIIIFKLARKFLPTHYSLLAVLLMSSNLVFSWQQTTAYVDLTRTFFESLALYLFLEQKFFKSAVSLGLAACTKILALSSLPIFLILILINNFPAKRDPALQGKLKIGIYLGFRYLILVFVVLSPWLLRAYLATGNPVYPFLSPMYTDTAVSLNPLDLWHIFTSSADPVNPIYLIILPVTVYCYSRWSRGVRLLFWYCVLSLAVWFLTPRSGGGRFILPYLPAFSVLTAITIISLKDKLIKNLLVVISLSLSLVSISYRLAANLKYLPVILGRQSASEFLTSHLNFPVGNYYDTDGYLATHLKPDSRIFVTGVNNLFYLNYSFTHQSYQSQPSPGDFLLLRPSQTSWQPPPGWTLAHTNSQTLTQLYAPYWP